MNKGGDECEVTLLETAGATLSVGHCWCHTHVNFGAPFELLYFRQHFNYKWYIKIDQCKVKHLLQVPCSPI